MSNNVPVKTILILAANPTNTAPLRLEQEIREIDEGLRQANKRSCRSRTIQINLR